MSEELDRVFEEDNKRENAAVERELLTIALLMRLYDVNLALLKHFDYDEAQRIYTEHAEGGNFNPPMFIPAFGETKEDSDDEPTGPGSASFD